MSEPPKIADELTNLPHVNVANLEPFQGDLKELTKREYSKLKKSLNENGVIVPFFVWLEENKLLDGHQRQRVFVSENWLIDVPVVYISADSEQDAKKKLLVISSQYGKVTQEGWDDFTFDLDDSWIKDTVQFDALPFVFGDLEEGEPEQDSGDAEPQIDRAEKLRKEWGVELGQMWRLPSRTAGQEHRLICGDCTDPAVVARVMGGERAALVVTDPPYGVRYHANKKGNKSASIEGDLTQALIPLSFAVAIDHALDDNARLYFFGGTANWPMYSKLFDYYLRMQPRPMIWVKESFVLHPTHYHSQFEIVFFGWKGSGGGPNYWYGDRKQPDVWNVSRDSASNRVHPTQKPVGVVEIPITNSAPKGAVVYEPFSGSGVCLIACENLSRRCRAIEIDPGYVAVALDRYERAFNITPELITH